MSNTNYFITAFGTFGNPNGFRQSYFFVEGKENIARNIKTFDLNTNAIKLFPQSKMYAIRKEYASGHNIISYSVYSFAKEQNSDRGGTFIGSSIVFVDKIAEENITLKLIDEFQNTLYRNNVKGNVISVNHSDQLSASKPTDYDKVENSLKAVENLNSVQSSNKILVVYCKTNPETIQLFFKKAIDLLNVYDTIYFTDSQEVATFVHQKGIFKLIQNIADKKEFEQEIQALHDERKRKIDSSISDFEREIQRLDDDKNKTINEFCEQIERNEKLHQENEKKIKESKKELEQVKQIYNDFSDKIKALTNQLKSGKKMDDVKKLYNENKRIFIDSVHQIKRPNFVNNIQKPIANTGLRTEQNPVQTKHNDYQENDEDDERKRGVNIFKVATFILLPLWIATLVYFNFFNNDETQNTSSQTEETTDNQRTPENVMQSALNPTPNGELSETDWRAVSNEVKHGMSVNEVVQIIFDKNPTDIKSSYSSQSEAYAQELIKRNKDCFQDNDGNEKKTADGKPEYTKGKLEHIPCFTKEVNKTLETPKVMKQKAQVPTQKSDSTVVPKPDTTKSK